MKPTNTNIAKYYGLDRKTIGTYRTGKGGDGKARIYIALKAHFIKAHEEKGK